MDAPLGIGILHYSCPPVVGGVEEILRQQASIFHRTGHSVSVLAGMGEVYTKDLPVRIEPVLGSKNARIIKAQEECKESGYAFIDCDSLPKTRDKVHYNTRGLVTMGNAFAKTVVTLIAQSKAPQQKQ